MWLLPLLCYFLLPPMFLLPCVAARKPTKRVKTTKGTSENEMSRKNKSGKSTSKVYAPSKNSHKTRRKTRVTTPSRDSRKSIVTRVSPSTPMITTPITTGTKTPTTTPTGTKTPTTTTTGTTTTGTTPSTTPTTTPTKPTPTTTTGTTTTTTNSKEPEKKNDQKAKINKARKKSQMAPPPPISAKQAEEVYNSIGLTDEQIELVEKMPEKKRRRFLAYAQINLYEELLKLDEGYAGHMQRNPQHEPRVCSLCRRYRDVFKGLATSHREFFTIIPDSNAVADALTELDDRLLCLPGAIQYCNESKKYKETEKAKTEGHPAHKKDLAQIREEYKKNYPNYRKKESEIRAKNQKDKEGAQKKSQNKTKPTGKKHKETKEKHKSKKNEKGKSEKKVAAPGAEYEQLDLPEGVGAKVEKKKSEAKYESLFDEDLILTAETQESLEENFDP